MSDDPELSSRYEGLIQRIASERDDAKSALTASQQEVKRLREALERIANHRDVPLTGPRDRLDRLEEIARAALSATGETGE